MRSIRSVFLLLTLFSGFLSSGQKQAIIPEFINDPGTAFGQEFSWSKTYESPNFILIWGNKVGTDPAAYPDPWFAFNPAALADTLEYIYRHYRQWNLIKDPAGSNMAKYKVPLIIGSTWGPDAEIGGFAWAGIHHDSLPMMAIDVSGLRDGGVIAHEFAHCLQYMTYFDHQRIEPGYAFAESAGIFHETHANFMSAWLYPQNAIVYAMDFCPNMMWGDWRNTYLNYQVLMHIALTHGLDMVNEMWRKSYDWEYPLQTYGRLLGSQTALNDQLFRYAQRMVSLDFGASSGTMRKERSNYKWNQGRDAIFSNQSLFTILRRAQDNPDHYAVPLASAPEDAGYNIIPLHKKTTTTGCINIRFRGHTELNKVAGWRYGLITLQADGRTGQVSAMGRDSTGILSIQLTPRDSAVYLVVLGAPVDSLHMNSKQDTWTGYPSHYRYPYDILIEGAVPEGYQPKQEFRPYLKTAPGHFHANGGGWVDDAAMVAPEVFVDSMAHVLGSSILTGNGVRIEGTSVVYDAELNNKTIVSDNAVIRASRTNGAQQVIIKDMAVVQESVLGQSAVVNERAWVMPYRLGGDINVGGDVLVYKNDTCGTGVYRVLTNYYDNKALACDGRSINFPENRDVNNPYKPMSVHDLLIGGVTDCEGRVFVNTFEATRAGCQIRFSWSAENQLWIQRYEIQLSADGGPFRTLFTKQATANPAQYYMQYATPGAKGSLLVRLKVVLRDGTEHITTAPSILFTGNCFLIYPNPVETESRFTAEFYSDTAAKAKVRIYNSAGQLLYTAPFNVVSGINKIQIPVNNTWSAGLYLFTLQGIEGSSLRYQEKLIKLTK